MVDNWDDKKNIEEEEDNKPYSQDYILDLQARYRSYMVGIIYTWAILEALGEVASI